MTRSEQKIAAAIDALKDAHLMLEKLRQCPMPTGRAWVLEETIDKVMRAIYAAEPSYLPHHNAING